MGSPPAGATINGQDIWVDTTTPQYLDLILRASTSSGKYGDIPLKIAICGYTL
jgi:hypothetical protein